jgi:hypothetical protein
VTICLLKTSNWLQIEFAAVTKFLFNNNKNNNVNITNIINTTITNSGGGSSSSSTSSRSENNIRNVEIYVVSLRKENSGNYCYNPNLDTVTINRLGKTQAKGVAEAWRKPTAGMWLAYFCLITWDTQNASGMIFFSFLRRALQEKLRAHRSLKGYCATLWWKWRVRLVFFIFSSNGAPVEWNWQGTTEVLGEKPVPVPLCPPQIPHGLTRDRTRCQNNGTAEAWSFYKLSMDQLLHYKRANNMQTGDVCITT